MRGMPYNLQGKGVVVAEVVTPKWKKVSSNSSEPTSVLDTRRSPSPTSTSTLSSSLGGSGSTDSGGGGGGGGPTVAAVSGEGPPQKWPLNETRSNSYEDGSKKEEWASDLQPIPVGLEIAGNDKGLAMEDWESIISESPASPSHDQSLLKWIMREMDDPSGLRLHQVTSGSGGGGGGSDFEDAVNGDSGFGLVDPAASFGFSIDASMGGGGGGAVALGGISLSSSPITRTSNPTNNSSSLSLPVKLPSFNGGAGNSIFSSSPNLPLQLPLPLLNSPMFYQQTLLDGGPKIESMDEKPHLLHHQPLHLMNQSQNPGCFFPLSFAQSQQHELPLPPHPKRHQTLVDQQLQLNQNWPPPPVKQECQIPALKVPYSDSAQEIFMRRQQQPHQQQAVGIHHSFAPSQQHLVPHLSSLHERSKPKVGLGSDEAQQQPLIDQLLKAAEQVESGDCTLARAILARLNHQLSPVGKPLQRAAFYFMEALHLLLITSSNPSQRSPLSSSLSPLDVVLKIGAYKVFSEVSPLLQFAHFTCNQALLEALDGFNSIHIIDFEIGLGGQWASFMQEIALKRVNSPSLKITAFTSPAAHDPLELSLARQNLTHFANDLNISFEFNFLNLESFEASMLNISDNEAVAVNFPIGSHLSFASNSIPSLLRLVKQISPKIVVSIDRGCYRSDLSFSHHFRNALHSYSILLDSLDATNANSDDLQKIERFLIKPRIESIIAGRHRSEKIPHWKNLFLAAGFSPVPFSNFTETQADWVVKRNPVRGFHFEKQHTSLLLCWQQRGELISVTAWRCCADQ